MKAGLVVVGGCRRKLVAGSEEGGKIEKTAGSQKFYPKFRRLRWGWCMGHHQQIEILTALIISRLDRVSQSAKPVQVILPPPTARPPSGHSRPLFFVRVCRAGLCEISFGIIARDGLRELPFANHSD